MNKRGIKGNLTVVVYEATIWIPCMNKNQTNKAPATPIDPLADLAVEPACSTFSVSTALVLPESFGSELVVWTIGGSWVTAVD